MIAKLSPDMCLYILLKMGLTIAHRDKERDIGAYGAARHCRRLRAQLSGSTSMAVTPHRCSSVAKLSPLYEPKEW